MIDNEQDIIQQLQQLHGERSELDEMLGKTAERLQPAIQIALANVDARIVGILEDPLTSELVEQQEIQLQSDASLIQGLIDKGLLPETVGEEQLKTLASHEDYQLLRMVTISRGYGVVALSGATQGEVTHPDEQASLISQNDSGVLVEDSTAAIDENEIIESAVPTGSEEVNPNNLENRESAVEKQPARVTIITKSDGSKVLKVGQRKRYDFSKANRANQTDYTAHRQLAFEMIVAAEGEVVKANDIGKAIKEAGLKYSPASTSGNIASWLKQIDFYGSELICDTGLRGSGAGFFVSPNFDVSLEYKTIQQVPQKRTTTTATAQKRRKPSSQETRSEEFIKELEKGTLPLRESAILMTYLHYNRDLLEALHINSPEEQMVDEIVQASDEEDIKSGISRINSLSSDVLDQERINVALQFRAVFSNNELFDLFVDNIPTGDVLEPMGDYLGSLDDEAWDTLINQVLKANQSTEIIQSSEGKNGFNFKQRINTITLPNGRQFRRIIGTDDCSTSFEEVVHEPRTWAETDEIDLGEREVEVITPKIAKDTVTNKATEKEKPVAEKSTVSEVETVPQAKKPSTKEKAPQWETDLKKAIGETLKELEDQGLIFEGELDAKRIGKIAKSKKMATEEAIKRLISNGRKPITKIGTNPHEWTFDLPSVVTMYIQNTFSNIFDSTQRRRKANSIIDNSVNSFMNEWRKRQDG